MAHPLSPVSIHDSTSDPLSSSTHEVKAYDDPLQSHAAAWSTPPSKAEDETQQSTLHTKTTTKPIAIPRTLLDELNDPEATPTAPAAFPSTPTSSSSLHGGGGDRPWHDSEQHEGEHDSDEDASHLAGGTSVASSSAEVHAAHPPVQTSPKPALKPVSIKALRTKVCKAAGRGDISQLVSLLHPDTSADNDSSIIDSEYPSSFALVNSSTATGSTPLLEAASHGHLHIVRYLLEEEGAMRDLEDSQGENAFLKAAYRGHLDIMKYLHQDALSEQEHQNQEKGEEDKHHATGNTDVKVADKQGWTALHNACSKGYLEIVMWLAEHGAEIDARSHQGYTPLMNAASKGHLPIVHYLLVRHTPNPFIRNAYQETAYDVAVATFELGIADILSNYESRLWNDHQAHFTSHQSTSIHASTPHLPKPYNPLGMHITVPIVFYENQRLDLRWFSRTKRSLTNPISNSSNASQSNRPPSSTKFTSAALSRRDGHASSELPPSYDGINPTGRWIPLRRNDLALPTILNPRQIQLPPMPLSRNGRPPLQRNTSSNRSQRSFTSPRTPDTVEPSTPTMLPPEAEAAWFWLSSKTFIDLSPANIDPEQGWQYATSFDVQEDKWKAEMPEQVARLLAGAVDAQESREAKNVKWVRRRRWARIMRRRIDIPHWGFDDDPEDIHYQDHKASGDEATRHVDGEEGDVELAPMRSYLERAQYYAGSHIKHPPHSQQQGSQNLDESDASPSLSAKDGDDTMSLRSYNTVIAGPQAEEEMDRASGRKIIARLERALQELHAGIEEDQDEVRKLQATTLVEIFQERLNELLLRFPQADNEDDAESFRYPGADDDSELDETSSISTSHRSSSLYSPISNGSPGASFRRSSSSSASDAMSLLSGLQATSIRNSPSSPSSTTAPLRNVRQQQRPDLSRQLSSNPDFAVPTSEEPPLPNVPISQLQHHHRSHEQAQTPATSTRGIHVQRSSVPWEPDEATSECRRCSRRFTFFQRKHHCRRCGLVVCAHCSSHHDYLRANEVVLEPGSSSYSQSGAAGAYDPIYGIYASEGGFYRTCDVCHEDIRRYQRSIDPDLLLNPSYFTSTSSSLGRNGQEYQSADATSASPTTGAPTPTLAHYSQALDNNDNHLSPAISNTSGRNDTHDQQHGMTNDDGSPMQRSISDMSELGECPVCGTNLENIPDKEEQEIHIQKCLESGTSTRLQDNRYLVFTLPDSSPLVGTDCLICFESYEAGELIGRLSCLCHFHRECIANWLSRGKSCPVHAR